MPSSIATFLKRAAGPLFKAPDADGAAGECLVTDGGGNLSFTAREAAGAAAAAVAAHVAASDPHAQYLTAAEGNAAYAAAAHNHDGTYQPLDQQLIDLAALSYSGNALKALRVNTGANGLEFAAIGAVPALINGGRLTTESGVPVSTTDRAAQGTLYFTPHAANQIALYDGSGWALLAFTERSLVLAGLTSGRNHDVFGYNSAGTLVLELAAWTNDTTRAAALAQQDGVWVKSGDPTRRYLGTIRTTSASTTEDSLTKRFVWNADNRVQRALEKGMGSSSHTYTSATIRQYNADTTAQVELVVGLIGDEFLVAGGALIQVSSAGLLGRIGVGENSTTGFVTTANNVWTQVTNGNPIVVGHTTPRVGYSVYSLNEQNQSGSGTITFDFGRMWGMVRC